MHDRPSPASILTPLRVAVVASAGADDQAGGWCVELAASPRLAVEGIVLGRGGWLVELLRLWRALRGSTADVALFCSPSAGSVVVPAARLAGVRTVRVARTRRSGRGWSGRLVDATLHADLRDPDERERLVADLAAIAGRPGAGLAAGPPLSVVVTVLNEGPAVDRLLERLGAQLGPDDEALVVDGGSSDDTPERIGAWIRRDPRIRLLRAPGANISAGRNRGLAAASHPVVACTDAGCDPADGWLEALRAPFAEADPPSLVTGLYRAGGDRSIDQAMAAANYPDPDEARRPGPLVWAYGRVLGRTFDPTLCTGRSMAVTVEAWRAAGGFPEALAIGEDVAFGRSVARTGRRCVLAVDAEVEWSPRPSLAASARMYHAYGRGDGESGERLLVARNLARLLAYLSCVPLWRWGGRRGRLAAAAGAVVYLSLPVARGLRCDRPLSVLPRVPLALAVKDLAKAIGCLRGGLAARRR